MNILMIGACPPVGQTLKKGLKRLMGYHVTLIDDSSVFDDDVIADYSLNWSLGVRKGFGDGFDVVHIHSPNLKKWLLAAPYVRAGVPLVCHWHGSDLRLFWKSWPVKQWCINHAKMNLYSTPDLAWWIKGRKSLIFCPVDCDVFQPGENSGQGKVTFDGGAQAFQQHRIPHKEMPGYLRQFEFASIHNAMGLDDTLFSIIGFECAASGLIVEQYPWMTRDWVLDNASLPVIIAQLVKIYLDVVQ